jgi:hypothetical protein
MMDYPNTGLLLTNTRKTADKQPDMTGDIKLERDFLLDLIENSDDVIVIKLGAWLKKDKNGNRMVSLKADSNEQPKQSTQKDPWDD